MREKLASPAFYKKMNPKEKLKKIFDILKKSTYRGVPGVLAFESTHPGPTIGITICTHGNEPSGLAVAEYLLNFFAKQELSKGTVILVLNNIKATEKYLEASTEEGEAAARYVDLNMNRMPKNFFELKNDSRYEIQRAIELQSIWTTFTFGLDIHSTTIDTKPMIISSSRNNDSALEIIRNFPITILITGIDKVQIGSPAFNFYGNDTTPVFAIEVGQHSNVLSFERAISCVNILLINFQMIPHITSNPVLQHNEYAVQDILMFENDTYDFIRDFQSYDSISKNELLAKNAHGGEIRARYDGHLIFPTSKRGSEKDISEEVAFISLPVKIR